jgi:hypothetical protein
VGNSTSDNQTLRFLVPQGLGAVCAAPCSAEGGGGRVPVFPPALDIVACMAFPSALDDSPRVVQWGEQ